MPTFVVDPSALARDLEATGRRALDAVVDAVRTTVKLRAPAMAQALVDAEVPKPVDRGTYRRSFRAQDLPNGVAFYNASPHGPIIEDGRRPGARMPPVEVIYAWVKRKKIGAVVVGPVSRQVRVRATTGGKIRVVGSHRGAVEKQQRHIALQIARAIKKRGLPAHHILRRVEAALTPVVMTAIEQALEGVR